MARLSLGDMLSISELLHALFLSMEFGAREGRLVMVATLPRPERCCPIFGSFACVIRALAASEWIVVLLKRKCVRENGPMLCDKDGHRRPNAGSSSFSTEIT